MKRRLPFVLVLFAVLGLLFLNACQKDDTSPPVITVLGSPVIYISLNSQYSPALDAGATAYDNKDLENDVVVSDISPTNPNVNMIGTYIITFRATDRAGNKATAIRTVIVKNDAEFLANNYNVVDTVGATPYLYAQTITMDPTKNNRIHFSQFGNYLNNTKIYADVTVDKDSLIIPFQTADNIGSGQNELHKFSGTAVITGQNFILNYIDNNLITTVSENAVAHYTKQ